MSFQRLLTRGVHGGCPALQNGAPIPTPLPREVYLPRVAFDRVTEDDVIAAKRLDYTASLHWRVSRARAQRSSWARHFQTVASP